MSGPLAGVRIVDLTSVVMGPYATQILADYGADVIKVESPDGDVMRLAGPMRHPGMGHLYLNNNRNKRSIVIDLKQEAGREVLLDLIRNADVLVYNIRQRAMTRLGLSYEAVCAVNPAIIYAGAFGFSQRGPYAGRPAYDDLIQGMVGIPWLSQAAGAGEPRYAPVILADRIVGLQLATAIVSAVVHRDRTGRGQRVEVPMYEGLASMILGEHLGGRMFDPPQGEAGYQRSLSPYRRPYRTRDGFLCLMIYTDRHWQRFFESIGEAERFHNDPRFSTHGERTRCVDEVYAWVAGVIATRTTAEWLQLCDEADIPAARMASIEDILADEHLAATGFFQRMEHPTEGPILMTAIPVEWSDSRPDPLRPAPGPGDHTEEILAEAGYAADRISELCARRAVRCTSGPAGGQPAPEARSGS